MKTNPRYLKFADAVALLLGSIFILSAFIPLIFVRLDYVVWFVLQILGPPFVNLFAVIALTGFYFRRSDTMKLAGRIGYITAIFGLALGAIGWLLHLLSGNVVIPVLVQSIILGIGFILLGYASTVGQPISRFSHLGLFLLLFYPVNILVLQEPTLYPLPWLHWVILNVFTGAGWIFIGSPRIFEKRDVSFWRPSLLSFLAATFSLVIVLPFFIILFIISMKGLLVGCFLGGILGMLIDKKFGRSVLGIMIGCVYGGVIGGSIGIYWF